MDNPDVFISRLFSYGFRPLFACTVASAIVLVGWWIGVWYGWLPAPTSSLSPLTWHAHEMLFGFVGSAIGGFLLTAVANWTQRAPVSGWPLALLVICWMLARLVLAYDLRLAPWLLMLIDASYWLLLTALMAREVISVRNFRNLKIVGILLVFSCMVLLFHLDEVLGIRLGSQALSIRATIFLVCIMISVIGGRIIPAFTGNWLRARFGPDNTLPKPFDRFDVTATVATVLAGTAFVIWPERAVTGALLVVAGLLQLGRVTRWQGHRTLCEPLVLVLHVGYAWLGFGILLLGTSQFGGITSPSAGIHALGVGAMAGLIVAVSSRAAMGHTNRPLASDKLLSTAFLLINLAALARVVASSLNMSFLLAAGILWLLAFVAFAIKIGPILVGPPAGRAFPNRIQ